MKGETESSSANSTGYQTELSERISYAILRVSDALGDQLDGFSDGQKQRLWPLMREQLPPILFERYASRLPERLPWEYIKNMLSSGGACAPIRNQVWRKGRPRTCHGVRDANGA